MADMSWSDIIRNRGAYPDDMVVDINGAAIALGDLRNTAIPKEDMTRLTQGWSQREQAARVQIETLQSQLAQALTEREQYAQQQAATAPYNGNGTNLIDYERDPILGPIFQASREALDRQVRTDANIDRLEKMLQGIGSQLGQWPVVMALDQIKRNDPYGVDPQELVQHALAARQGPPNLNDSYALLTREKREQQIRQEAEAAALEKAKRELAVSQVPFHPWGPPQTIKTPDPTYATLDEAENAAVMDPEMLAIMMGQTG